MQWNYLCVCAVSLLLTHSELDRMNFDVRWFSLDFYGHFPRLILRSFCYSIIWLCASDFLHCLSFSLDHAFDELLRTVWMLPFKINQHSLIVYEIKYVCIIATKNPMKTCALHVRQCTFKAVRTFQKHGKLANRKIPTHEPNESRKKPLEERERSNNEWKHGESIIIFVALSEELRKYMKLQGL